MNKVSEQLSMSKDFNKICQPEIFESIFYKYAKELKRFIFFKTQDIDLTEDILQETFIRLWDNCDNVSYEKVRAYLYAVANNLFLNIKKHEKVVWAYQKHQVKQHDNESPEFLLLEKEFMIKIERTINELPENQKEVFLLNRIEKKKYREIAEILGVSIKTVEKRMHHALLYMKDKIGKV